MAQKVSSFYGPYFMDSRWFYDNFGFGNYWINFNTRSSTSHQDEVPKRPKVRVKVEGDSDDES